MSGWSMCVAGQAVPGWGVPKEAMDLPGGQGGGWYMEPVWLAGGRVWLHLEFRTSLEDAGLWVRLARHAPW